MFESADENGVLQGRIGKDARSWFTEVTGTDPEMYRALLMFVMHHGYGFNIEAPNLPDLVYDMGTMLQNVAPEPASAYRHLHDLAIVDEQLPANDPSDWESAVYGFHYLRRRPVLHLGRTQYICLHKHLLYEKFFGGTVHVLTELVISHPPPGWPGERKERINKVRRELGYIFEDYVRKLLELLFTGSGVIRRYGLRRKGGGESDALVVVGSVALAFEVVHHPWNLAERARGESVDFIRHLADNIKKAGDLCTQITREGRVADLEVSVDTALPIVIMSEMMPINEITALTWQHDLIAATSRGIGARPWECSAGSDVVDCSTGKPRSSRCAGGCSKSCGVFGRALARSVCKAVWRGRFAPALRALATAAAIRGRNASIFPRVGAEAFSDAALADGFGGRSDPLRSESSLTAPFFSYYCM